LLSIVATHGRDRHFEIGATMGLLWEEALRQSLELIYASYAHTIPYHFAFYGNLWRRDIPEDLVAQITQLGFAEDLLQELGLPIPPQKEEEGGWDILADTIAVLDRHLHIGPTILKRFLADLSEYFRDRNLRLKTMQRLETKIRDAGSEVLLLAHSMGTIVSYDLLMRKPELPVYAIITFGSPLGLPSIHNNVALADGSTPFPAYPSHWINIYNRQDFVAAVHKLAPLFPANGVSRIKDWEMIGRDPTLLNPLSGHDPIIYLSSSTMGVAVHAIVEQWMATQTTSEG